MQERLGFLQSILDLPFIRRVRRNHGLEHATIHLLAQRIPHLRVVGRSDGGGFWLYGNIPTDDVRACASNALERLRKGEHQLAVHPNCGTNLLTVAILGTVAVLVALLGSERERFGKLQRAPLIALGLVGAMILGQPLGIRLQQYVTTSGDPADLEIVAVRHADQGNLIIHRVETRST